jgi:hypothetical protein
LTIDFTHFVGLSKSTPNFAKSGQARPNPGQENQRKKAWISLDSLGGIEPFQWVVVTPQGRKSFLASSLAIGLRQVALSFPSIRQGNTVSNFHKQNAWANSATSLSIETTNRMHAGD